MKSIPWLQEEKANYASSNFLVHWQSQKQMLSLLLYYTILINPILL